MADTREAILHELGTIRIALDSIAALVTQPSPTVRAMTRSEAIDECRRRWGTLGFIERSRDGLNFIVGYHKDDGVNIRLRFVCGQGKNAGHAFEQADIAAAKDAAYAKGGPNAW